MDVTLLIQRHRQCLAQDTERSIFNISILTLRKVRFRIGRCFLCGRIL